jgi:hypothetical protein
LKKAPWLMNAKGLFFVYFLERHLIFHQLIQIFKINIQNHDEIKK